MPRLPPAQLTPAQRQLYDEIANGPRAAGPFALTDERDALLGPFGAMLLSPDVGAALQALGAAVRYRSALTPRIREMAVLVVAAHWRSDFERHAHSAVGRLVGLSEAELAALQDEAPLELADPAEAVALATVRALVDDGDLDDAGYGRACQALGERGVFELTTLVGYYATLALQLRVFRVPAPN
ncbi:MAG TPA: carboxymuconolactone decarboxylase family protein [Actinomycetes bacterium]|nr:carboxymuconolactone decarboxylase family protein [Actinomycetes bacterium]